ncbi:sugar nucleotide-binding protein [Paenibacillus medicaginis]|uniref:Sugar nucleotide-binding protein n=1 Tax=Paenibacillus medicaginis TaxID=1470560 RepID=A0ABV5C8N7_9BACL
MLTLSTNTSSLLNAGKNPYNTEDKLKAVLLPCSTDKFPRPAPRPANSVMDHLSIRVNDLTDFRPWREALQDFLRELASAQETV